MFIMKVMIYTCNPSVKKVDRFLEKISLQDSSAEGTVLPAALFVH
jgi:hypothetical protein